MNDLDCILSGPFWFANVFFCPESLLLLDLLFFLMFAPLAHSQRQSTCITTTTTTSSNRVYARLFTPYRYRHEFWIPQVLVQLWGSRWKAEWTNQQWNETCVRSAFSLGCIQRSWSCGYILPDLKYISRKKLIVCWHSVRPAQSSEHFDYFSRVVALSMKLVRKRKITIIQNSLTHRRFAQLKQNLLNQISYDISMDNVILKLVFTLSSSLFEFSDMISLPVYCTSCTFC